METRSRPSTCRQRTLQQARSDARTSGAARRGGAAEQDPPGAETAAQPLEPARGTGGGEQHVAHGALQDLAAAAERALARDDHVDRVTVARLLRPLLRAVPGLNLEQGTAR